MFPECHKFETVLLRTGASAAFHNARCMHCSEGTSHKSRILCDVMSMRAVSCGRRRFDFVIGHGDPAYAI